MRRRIRVKDEPITPNIVAALDALGAEDLRTVVLDMLAQIDERTHGQVVEALFKRAARRASGWTPATPSNAAIAEVTAFAADAKREGYADPSDVDDCLQHGSTAFLAGDYTAALQIFAAILIPIADVEIDLGQEETIDEVLGSDPAACAAQYVVARYVTTDPDQRAAAVREAIAEMDAVGYFSAPLAALEAAAVEPLPDFDAFLKSWKALLRQESSAERKSSWGCDVDDWLREVTERTAGAQGLAELARATKHSGDLDAWCRFLAEGEDWQGALGAYAEAADLVGKKDYAHAEFLDGAALAAQRLGRRDLPSRLERAWLARPTMLRLRRWLGCAGNRRALRARVGKALEACPKRENRQQALLHVLGGDVPAAAQRLAAAPGLGWSDDEHPGPMLFELFPLLLGVIPPSPELPTTRLSCLSLDIGEMEYLTDEEDCARVNAPSVQDLVALAGRAGEAATEDREVMLRAMRKAAGKRVRGVTSHKRRRYYDHAARLVAACVAPDPTAATRQWLARLRSTYGGYPALKRELDRHVDPPGEEP